MKKTNLLITAIVVMSLAATNVSAHPPQDMDLTYDKDSNVLEVSIAHSVPPAGHYVNRLVITKNDVQVIEEEYSSQTSDEFTKSFTIDAEIGDEITVTAYCNIQGSITRSITIEDPNADDPPTIEIKNPTAGYFHFSGIKLFATYLNVVSDTMGFGGFRLRPLQFIAEDDNDESKNLEVKVFIDGEKHGDAEYNPNSGYHEIKWTG
ncbi:MAG: hypothetical protein V5A68_01230, partial [Candidatus Thermoplasmatota archaeon]